MAILGFLFGRIYRLLPGKTGAVKGLTFGLIGWVMMGLIFYPLIGLDPKTDCAKTHSVLN